MSSREVLEEAVELEDMKMVVQHSIIRKLNLLGSCGKDGEMGGKIEDQNLERESFKWDC